jgi:RNA polymerase-binding transcription factor DksA
MNREDQKIKLITEKDALEKNLNALGILGEDGSWMVVPDEGDGTHADSIDNADITEDFEEKIARLNVLESQYVQVKKALAAIENNTYGICEVSGETISEERLSANPSSTTCINHAE